MSTLARPLQIAVNQPSWPCPPDEESSDTQDLSTPPQMVGRLHTSEQDLDTYAETMSPTPARRQMARKYWEPNNEGTECAITSCGNQFGSWNLFSGRHHCRACGRVVCAECSLGTVSSSPPAHSLFSSHLTCPPLTFFLCGCSASWPGRGAKRGRQHRSVCAMRAFGWGRPSTFSPRRCRLSTQHTTQDLCEPCAARRQKNLLPFWWPAPPFLRLSGVAFARLPARHACSLLLTQTSKAGAL